jgi:hypothetical protein
MERPQQRFPAAHDYGMGGIWMYTAARRATGITDAYPELAVFDEAPPSLSKWHRAKRCPVKSLQSRCFGSESNPAA